MSLSKKNNYLVLYLDFDGVLNIDMPTLATQKLGYNPTYGYV